MPDHGANLLKMVLESPDDDGPRLVYADWLEEHGECDRAEFIRVQCELASLMVRHGEWELGTEYTGVLTTEQSHDGHSWYVRSDKVGMCEYLRRRELSMWDEWGDDSPLVPDVSVRWIATASRRSASPGRRVFVWRGFIDSVRCPWNEWVWLADYVHGLHPIRKVTITNFWLAYRGESPFVQATYVPGYRCAEEEYWWSVSPTNRENPRASALALNVRWPGIKFVLPPSKPGAGPGTQFAALDEAPPMTAGFYERVRRAFTAGTEV